MDGKGGGGGGGAGLWRYLKEAFFFRWNLLLFLGSAAAAALSPAPDILLPLVGAAEATYLAGLVSIPRFRAAIDAKAHGEGRALASSGATTPAMATRALGDLVAGLPDGARERFARLRARCLGMQALARGADAEDASASSTSGLDRLLWVFLRLLRLEDSLARFLRLTDEVDLAKRIDDLRKRIAEAEKGGDERIIRSLKDSLATAEMRIDNYQKAKKNAEFVTIELDRIEAKIQAVSELAVSRQDPDFMSSQVDSVAHSIQHTEKTLSELTQLAGIADVMEEPPAILATDLKEVLPRGRGKEVLRDEA